MHWVEAIASDSNHIVKAEHVEQGMQLAAWMRMMSMLRMMLLIVVGIDAVVVHVQQPSAWGTCMEESVVDVAASAGLDDDAETYLHRHMVWVYNY